MSKQESLNRYRAIKDYLNSSFVTTGQADPRRVRQLRNEALTLHKEIGNDEQYSVKVMTGDNELIGGSKFSLPDMNRSYLSLSLSFARHFGTPNDFDGHGGRMTKAEWIAYHEKRTGIKIGPEVWVVDVDGEEVERIRVCERVR